jgi:hypothetical protein
MLATITHIPGGREPRAGVLFGFSEPVGPEFRGVVKPLCLEADTRCGSAKSSRKGREQSLA